MFLLLSSRFLVMQQLDYNNGNGAFLCGPCQDVMQGTRSVEFCMEGCEERTGAREAEKSPLLEAIDREQLVKTQEAGKRLRRCCGDL
jgi:hypothetical protein